MYGFGITHFRATYVVSSAAIGVTGRGQASGHYEKRNPLPLRLGEDLRAPLRFEQNPMAEFLPFYNGK